MEGWVSVMGDVRGRRKLQDDALLIRVDLAVLVDAGHMLVVTLLGFDFVWEPFLEEGGEVLVEVVCGGGWLA